ncbi:hypothetical protein IWW36_001569 [Coemansia brasiliensis]|uniref:4-coumarate--CoA ligase n=1 Tax=Coemansia brasiliensis TaxID=2650707 RepID=A0A9W8M087_9FUNG|nr:hypothetical protein IWW36_001569 [Coemansia brasiliensis]
MVFKSIVPQVEIPSLDVASFCIGASKINAPSPGTLAYHDLSTSESLTHGELASMHEQIGSGLVNQLKVQAGNIAAIFASNSVYYAPVFLGIISAGAVSCTVSSTFGESELEYQLEDCKASVLFVGIKQVQVVKQAIANGRVKIPHSRIIVMARSEQASGFRSLGSLLDSRPYKPLRINSKDVAARTMAVIVYSSGTTGLPKGVMLSHRNLVACAVLNAAVFQFQAEQAQSRSTSVDSEKVQRSIAILPFAHIYGLTSLVTNSVAGGRTQFIMSKFSISRFLQAIETFKIQVASVVPSIMNQIAKHEHLEQYDLSSLQVLGSGAAALPGGIHKQIRAKFSGNTVNGYGMSETCSGVCIMSNYKFTAGSVGFLYPGIEAKIVDPTTGGELQAGQEGELCLRGPTIMLGYLNRPKETQQVIKQGFLHTGDIAYIDSNGLVFITDRIKELIKYKGMQVAPAEIEGILMDHPQIADAAVIGVGDSTRGSEVPMALIVPKGRCDEKELCRSAEEWVANRAADHKRLRGGVRIINDIPRNASGKILHRDLRLQFQAQQIAKI